MKFTHLDTKDRVTVGKIETIRNDFVIKLGEVENVFLSENQIKYLKEEIEKQLK